MTIARFAALTLCISCAIGCRAVRSRSTVADKRPDPPAAAQPGAEAPQEELALGLASYEQFAEDPAATGIAKASYHFGESRTRSGSRAATRSGMSSASGRC